MKVAELVVGKELIYVERLGDLDRLTGEFDGLEEADQCLQRRVVVANLEIREIRSVRLEKNTNKGDQIEAV